MSDTENDLDQFWWNALIKSSESVKEDFFHSDNLADFKEIAILCLI